MKTLSRCPIRTLMHTVDVLKCYHTLTTPLFDFYWLLVDTDLIHG